MATSTVSPILLYGIVYVPPVPEMPKLVNFVPVILAEPINI